MPEDVAPRSDPAPDETTSDAGIEVVTRGTVPDGAERYAVEKIGALIGQIADPVLLARVKLTQAADPARERPATAQATVDINGEVVRAHVASHVMPEAIDLLHDRLRDRLEHRAEHRRELRRSSGIAEPGDWRHGDLPTIRPTYFDRPEEERQLVRHKTFAIDELTFDEAAFDMELLDYDFYLFRDLSSGEDSVLERGTDGGYRVTRLHPSANDNAPTAVAVEVAEETPAEATVEEAVLRLTDSGEPFVFFRNTSTQRGNVVYRRYDGHYGLITVDESTEGES